MDRFYKQLLLAFLLLGFNSIMLQAQNTHPQNVHNDLSFEEALSVRNRMFENRRNKIELTEQLSVARSNGEKLWTPIQFHIVRATDGSGGTTIPTVLNALCELNQRFDTVGIQFYLHSEVRQINQSLLYDDGLSNYATYYMRMYKVPGVLNVFVVNETPGAGGFYRGGVQDDYICLPLYAVQPGIINLTHEAGHYFSLPHPFFGWEDLTYGSVTDNANGRTPTILPSGVPVENLHRTGGLDNCYLAADGFCDTDPSYGFGSAGSSANNGCEYVSTAVDPNGYLFRPNVIAENAVWIQMNEDEPYPFDFQLQNLSNKDKIYPYTKVVVETSYTLGGTSTTMWSDTVGNSDTTRIFVPASTQNGGVDNIIGLGAYDCDPGFINFGGHYLDVNISSSNNNLSFLAAKSVYKITMATGRHEISMDSLRVTNTSSVDVVNAGTTVTATDIWTDGTTNISTNGRNYALPSNLAPGDSYTFGATDLYVDASQIAGVTFGANTYAPKIDTVLPPSENYMGYYLACGVDFTPEQTEAMLLDYAARDYSNTYPKPTDIEVTTSPTIIHPQMDAISPQPVVNFQWSSVNGATMYYIEVFEINFLDLPIAGGEKYELMLTTTDFWLTLSPGTRFGWKVTPMNASSYKFPGLICTDGATPINLTTTQANFEVFDWNVNIDQVQADILSSNIYPNPSGTTQNPILEINAKAVGSAQVSMFNSIGQEVLPAETLMLIEGANVQKLNVADLAAGLYIVNIETKSGRISHKLMLND
jgi:hypothetical protein